MDSNMNRKWNGAILFYVAILLVSWSRSVKSAVTTKTMRIVALLEPPYVMKDPTSGRFTGLMIDVLHEAGIEIDHLDTPVMEKGGDERQPGLWDGVVGQLQDGKYDMALAPLKVSSRKAKFVTFTQPVVYSGFMALYKIPKEVPNQDLKIMATAFKPFSVPMWFLLLLMCLVSSGVLYLIRRFSPYEDDDSLMATSTTTTSRPAHNQNGEMGSWSAGLLYMFGSLMGQNYSVTPKSTSGRILTLFWWLFAMMTVAAYIASLGVILFRWKDYSRVLPFASVKEMTLQTEVSVLGVKNSDTYNYMANHTEHLEKMVYTMWKENWDKLMVDSLDIALKMLEEGEGKYAVFMDESQADYLSSVEPCDKMVIGEPVGVTSIAFACNKNSTKICDDLNHVIVRLHETGDMVRLHHKWFWSGCHVSYNDYMEPFDGQETGQMKSQTTLTAKQFGAAFIMLTIGIVVAVMVLVVEVACGRRAGNRHHELRSKSDPANGLRCNNGSSQGFMDTTEMYDG